MKPALMLLSKNPWMILAFVMTVIVLAFILTQNAYQLRVRWSDGGELEIKPASIISQ